jgi:hypothetical protein
MIELELMLHYETLADPHAENYTRIADALGNPPLYHQWRTYKEVATVLIFSSEWCKISAWSIHIRRNSLAK